MKKVDLINKRFGRLVVIKEVERRTPLQRRFDCLCDCGITKAIDRVNLTSGRSQSCGCRQSEMAANINKSHGMVHHPLYKIWKSMKQRCHNPSNRGFRFYGGKGITVCGEWLNDPARFIRWGESNGYQKGLAIDRTKTHLGYSPENCRFITQLENNRNRRNTITLSLNGKTMTLAEWAILLGIKYDTLYMRYRAGWTTKRMLTP